MECLICNESSGYNRAVVDTTTGRELGAVCRRCELDQFGELVDDLESRTADTCLYCDRDGIWALPRWLPSTYEDDGRTVSYVDYDASHATLHLCDEHLAELGVTELAPTPDEPASIPTTGDS